MKREQKLALVQFVSTLCGITICIISVFVFVYTSLIQKMISPHIVFILLSNKYTKDSNKAVTSYFAVLIKKL